MIIGYFEKNNYSKEKWSNGIYIHTYEISDDFAFYLRREHGYCEAGHPILTNSYVWSEPCRPSVQNDIAWCIQLLYVHHLATVITPLKPAL